MRTATFVVLAATGAMCHTAMAQAVFYALEIPPGAMYTSLSEISADGQVATGFVTYSSTDRNAFRWTENTGVQELGGLPGNTGSVGLAINADGSVIVGAASYGIYSRAFRWTAATGMQNLGTLPGDTYSQADAVSADGSVLAGFSGTSASFRAMVWTAAAGMQDLGSLPGWTDLRALAISGDGSVIAGQGSVAGRTRAFRWTAATGMQDIGVTPGGLTAEIGEVNTDGSYIVGMSALRGFRYSTAGGMQDLGNLPSYGPYTFARTVNADGTVIGGFIGSLTPSTHRAATWTPAGGWVNLQEYLPTQGVNLTGWTLKQVLSVSADGRTIGGSGQHAGLYDSDGWIVQLPAPSACYANCDASTAPPILNVNDFVCFQSKFAAGDPAANCDGSTAEPILNVNDFICFQGKFAAGCP